jgi:anti-sigma regulatory factor (Ser/Thr protein kinase)
VTCAVNDSQFPERDLRPHRGNDRAPTSGADSVLQLSAVPQAPAAARQHVAGIAIPAPSEVRDQVLLIVSELVTNAVQHTVSRQVTLHATISTGCVRIAVHDFGDAIADGLRLPPDPWSVSGRGLVIVAALASRWGVVVDVPPPGKTVWAEVDV